MTYNEFIIKAALAASTGLFARKDENFNTPTQTSYRIATQAVEFATMLADEVVKELGPTWDEESA